MGKQRKTIRNKRKIGIDHYQNINETKIKMTKGISREVKLTIFSIFAITITMLSSTYAIFSSIQKSKNYNTLTVGTLKIDFNDTDTGLGNIINLNGAYPESNEEGQKETPYSFKITNSGNISAKYVIKILDDNDMIESDACQENLLDKSKIKVSLNKGEPFYLSEKENDLYNISNGTLSPNESKKYEIRIWIAEEAGNEVLGRHYHGKIIVEGENLTTNTNIVSAYQYNKTAGDNYCITGEEPTCQPTTCYKNKTANNCSAGTIIKYAINDTEEKYFYVLHDDGATLTMQQRENTINNSAWYADSLDNTKGPLTILPALERATAGWSNVNDQTYTLGTTTFGQSNGYTGCSVYNSCTINTYTLSERTAKARMITLQEATNLGCTRDNQSCPIWMYNYLNDSTSYGETINNNSIDTTTGTKNYGYWSMNASYSDIKYAWGVYYNGTVDRSSTNIAGSSARAVIIINK